MSEIQEVITQAMSTRSGQHMSIDEVMEHPYIEEGHFTRNAVREALGRLARDDDSEVERVEHGVYCYLPEVTPPEDRETHTMDEELFWEGGESSASGLQFSHVADIPHSKNILLQDSIGRFWKAHLADVVDL